LVNGQHNHDVPCRHYLLQSLKNSRKKEKREMGKEKETKKGNKRRKKKLDVSIACQSDVGSGGFFSFCVERT
jgi:hypothetical protein